MLKTAVVSRKGGVTRHGSFHYEGAPPGRGDKNSIVTVSYPENVVPDQKMVLTDDSRTVLSRHESFLSEKEKTFFRLKEPLLGKKVNILSTVGGQCPWLLSIVHTSKINLFESYQGRGVVFLSKTRHPHCLELVQHRKTSRHD